MRTKQQNRLARIIMIMKSRISKSQKYEYQPYEVRLILEEVKKQFNEE